MIVGYVVEIFDVVYFGVGVYYEVVFVEVDVVFGVFDFV